MKKAYKRTNPDISFFDDEAEVPPIFWEKKILFNDTNKLLNLTFHSFFKKSRKRNEYLQNIPLGLLYLQFSDFK